MCSHIENTIIGIQNPGVEIAEVINPSRAFDVSEVIAEYGAKIQKGAFVSLIDCDQYGAVVAVTVFVADRLESEVYLQSNEFANELNIDTVGPVVVQGGAPEPEAYTVIGTDDYNEPFVATVTATSPEDAKEAGIAAGLVDAGDEHLVKIIAVYEGDLTESNVTGEAG